MTEKDLAGFPLSLTESERQEALAKFHQEAARDRVANLLQAAFSATPIGMEFTLRPYPDGSIDFKYKDLDWHRFPDKNSAHECIVDILIAGGVHSLQARDISFYILTEKIDRHPTPIDKIEISIEMEEDNARTEPVAAVGAIDSNETQED